MVSVSVREQNPLKQGLKQDPLNEGKWTFEVREQNPLKQGLKLDDAGVKFEAVKSVSKIH